MEETAKLFFELASPGRLSILSGLRDEPSKLSQVARRESATVQETFRQLQRLADARLIEKNPDGAYQLTTLGRVSLSLVPSFDFLSREKEFVLSHGLASLPPGFQERIGDLADARRLDQLDDLLEMEGKIIRDSQEYVWFMTDQLFGHPSHQPHREKSREISMRFLLPRKLDSEELERTLRDMGVQPEVRFIDRVDVILVLNEKAAGLAMPSMDGRMDYGRGFVGGSERFHRWCRDLYFHYWEGSGKK